MIRNALSILILQLITVQCYKIESESLKLFNESFKNELMSSLEFGSELDIQLSSAVSGIVGNNTSNKNELSITPYEFSISDSKYEFNSFYETERSGRKRRAVRRRKMRMPTGDEAYISLPYPRSRQCGVTADLITISPRNRHTRREYEIIANEMERSKVDIPNCANRGGCVKSYKIFKIRKIVNGCLWDRYLDRKHSIKEDYGTANERMLFYGTNDAWDVVDNGFDERLVTTGERAFGAGIYFATTSSAANELAYGKVGTGCPLHNRKDCTECKRRMILARVTLGKENTIVGGKKLAHAPVGYHSVVGTQPSNPYAEYVVYRGEQAYPEYLISYVIRQE